MKFKHSFAAGFLMQAVYILGYDRLQFSLLFQPGKRQVGLVGHGVRIYEIFPVVFKESFHVPHKKGMGQHFFRRKPKLLFCIIQSLF